VNEGAMVTKHPLGFCVLTAWLTAASSVVHADPEVQSLAIATGLVVLTAIPAPMPEEPDEITFEAGRFDPIRNVQPATTFGIEYRSGRSLLWKLRPFVGGGLTTEHSFYGYGGIRLATYWGERIVVTPSFAVGGYSRGSGKDLGHPPMVGRFGLDLEYRFDNDLRIGAAYHHMSNGKLLGQTKNPGTEIVGFVVSIPVP
jgi:lipid A 3-O-deacylase